MWSYWRDKYGIVDALEGQYKNLLISNSEIRHALLTIKINKEFIDKKMSELTPEDYG